MSPEQEEAACRRATAALETMAEAWTRGADLTATVAAIIGQDDAESLVEALVKSAWMEGAYAGSQCMSAQEIEEGARG